MMGYPDAIQTDGYAIVPDLIDAGTISHLIEQLESVGESAQVSRKSGNPFGIRNLLKVLPLAGEIACSEPLFSLAEQVLGHSPKIVRSLFFDKTPLANWKVAWHQDLTIAVRKQEEVAGYGPWSLKRGIPHVQPPIRVLESMLTLRVHLDTSSEHNGALNIIPGSHRYGRLSPAGIQRLREQRQAVSCHAQQGDVLAMRPLLLHASSKASTPSHRRVLHFEYASNGLAGGLEWYGS